ncbi:LytTR family transcriptional regulator DNA-binding domain-containing protein [Kordia jejudonensis]|uniref:LytTR family transcriptional regulator DNA-binding domain-containing protein n=1 Tax=Kordia jejudonensis TaxID=1348245 RepID=UPI00069A699F|nr:LytTR family transcriptional regulator DNA-binding domain-containing protein [Kordia jejudonensis]
MEKLTYYFQQKHQLIDNQNYYLKLAIIIGAVLTVFVYTFDPYDNYLAIPKYEIPIKIIQLGYGINTALVIYGLYWLIFKKLKYANEKRPWKTYHHWLLLIAIMSIAGFIGTVYHRFMMDVGEVATNYYLFVTIPRSILISVPLFIITILLDKLYTTKNVQKNNTQLETVTPTKTISPNKKIILKSPVVNQCIEVNPSLIGYVKASGNYVEIYSIGDKKPQLLRAPLRFIAEKLKPYHFIIKCHRQYYVNLQHVVNHKGNSQRIVLNLDGLKEIIPVSKSYTSSLLSHLEKSEK